MKLLRAKPWYSEANAQRFVSLCFLAIALLGIANAIVWLNLGFAFLYLVPLVLAAPFLSRWQAIAIAGICTVFAEGFSHLLDGYLWIPRAACIFITYTFVALLVREMTVYRRAAALRLQELEADFLQLHHAEQRLELLMNSTPVGIITVGADGTILSSNRAAHQIFDVGTGGLNGRSIDAFLPAAHAIQYKPGMTVEISGAPASGEALNARLWTSAFRRDGADLTMMVIAPVTSQVPR